MDEVSKFLGISMSFGVDISAPYAELPHFHATYGERRAVISIADGRVIDGDLGDRALGFVEEWLSKHRAALWSNWHAIHENRPPSQIEPLE